MFRIYGDSSRLCCGALDSELYGVILAGVFCASPSRGSKILRPWRRVAENISVKKILGITPGDLLYMERDHDCPQSQLEMSVKESAGFILTPVWRNCLIF